PTVSGSVFARRESSGVGMSPPPSRRATRRSSVAPMSACTSSSRSSGLVPRRSSAMIRSASAWSWRSRASTEYPRASHGNGALTSSSRSVIASARSIRPSASPSSRPSYAAASSWDSRSSRSSSVIDSRTGAISAAGGGAGADAWSSARSRRQAVTAASSSPVATNPALAPGLMPHAPGQSACPVRLSRTRRPLPAAQRASSLARVRFLAAATTDPGLRRPENEDAYLLDVEQGLFCVADGMGGHAAGEVASRLAVEVLAREMARPDVDAALDARLRAAVATANRAILEAAERDPALAGMGTTLTALALARDDGGFTIAHVGDSRAYLFRHGELDQLTADHTWVQQQVDAGMLTPE